jgi:hypothetical protein
MHETDVPIASNSVANAGIWHMACCLLSSDPYEQARKERAFADGERIVVDGM